MSYFVTVNDPAEIRKELLTASKQIIGVLRRYEHYQALRKAKMEAFTQLAKEWSELAKLQRKLKTVLPKTDVKPIMVKQMPAVKAGASAPQKTAMQARSKVDLLEEQLSKIESRLSQLQ